MSEQIVIGYQNDELKSQNAYVEFENEEDIENQQQASEESNNEKISQQQQSQEINVDNFISPQTSREKILSIVFSVGPIIMMIAVLVLFQLDSSLKMTVINFFTQLEEVNGYTVLSILAIGASLVIVSAPYLIFELCLGYTFNYFIAISFAVFAKFLGESTCYCITKYVLRDYFLKIFQNNEYFQILNKAVIDHPWKISHIMRANALMPLFLINFGSGLLKFTYLEFIFPAVLWGTVYSSITVYAGSQFHNIQQLVNNTSSHGQSQILMYFELSVLILSLILMVVVILISKMYFSKISKEIKIELMNKHLQKISEQQEQYSVGEQTPVTTIISNQNLSLNNSQLNSNENIKDNEISSQQQQQNGN